VRWPESGNDPATTEFIRQTLTTGRLAGIFTGHWHQSRYIAAADKKQCITAAALNGQYRIIRFT
jgi:hypothetical protein